MITKANNTVLDLVSPSIDALDMGGNRINNVGDPVLDTDVATQGFVLGQSFLPLSGGIMAGNIFMDNNRLIDLEDPIDAQDSVNLRFLQASNATQGYLNDPTVTRTSGDSFAVGIFQAAPLTAITPVATTTATTTRQLTNLFLRTIAGLNGIVENQGAFAVPPVVTATNISFSTTQIVAGAGTPFTPFSAGDKVIVSGSISNDGTYDVTSATGTTINTSPGLVAEGTGPSVSIFRVVQNATYHMFAAFETGVGTVDVAIDDNVAGSNIGTGVSAGWLAVRRLWSFPIDSASDIQDGIKLGNHWAYTTIANDLSTSSTSALLTSMRVPTGFSVLWHGGVGINTASVGGNSRSAVQLSSGLISAAHPANRPNVPGHHVMGSVTSFAADGGGSVSNIQTDTSGRIRSKMTNVAGVNAVYSLYTDGYTDERKA